MFDILQIVALTKQSQRVVDKLKHVEQRFAPNAGGTTFP